jgi:histidinol-phosphate/aromatic aminotransferase/cobyric acid decarboxylase-like protein
MKKDTFMYSCMSTGRNKAKSGQQDRRLFSGRVKSLFASHHLVGNFFHYRTAIKILGLGYDEVFEDGRLDLDPAKWADFGPLNFHFGPPKGVVSCLKKAVTLRNLTYYPPNIIPELKEAAAKTVFGRKCDAGFEIIATEGVQAAMA